MWQCVQCRSIPDRLPGAVGREKAAHRDNAQATECQHPDGSPHSLAGVQSHNVHVLHGRIGPCSVCCVICTCTYTFSLIEFLYLSGGQALYSKAHHSMLITVFFFISGGASCRALTVRKGLEASCKHLQNTGTSGKSTALPNGQRAQEVKHIRGILQGGENCCTCKYMNTRSAGGTLPTMPSSESCEGPRSCTVGVLLSANACRAGHRVRCTGAWGWMHHSLALALSMSGNGTWLIAASMPQTDMKRA